MSLRSISFRTFSAAPLFSSCRPPSSLDIPGYTYHTATAQDDNESTDGAGRSHDPGQSNEEDHTEDILDAGQKDTDQGAHPGRLLRWLGVRIVRRRNRVRVVGHRRDKSGHTRSLRNILLRINDMRGD